MGFIDTILVLVSLYLGLGAIFGAAFVTKGIARIDRVAKGSSPAFRALILPGSRFCGRSWRSSGFARTAATH